MSLLSWVSSFFAEMAISEGSEEFTIIDKCNSDNSEEEKLFDDCGQEEYMRDLSPDHLVKVEDGCGYDAVCHWLINCILFLLHSCLLNGLH